MNQRPFCFAVISDGDTSRKSTRNEVVASSNASTVVNIYGCDD
jgi:hypothetical protein